VGTVCAHSGDDFCIGTAVFGVDSSTVGVWVFDQTGSPLGMGRAGIASASSAVSYVSFGTSGCSVESACAHTGVVSRVGTAVTGLSWVDSDEDDSGEVDAGEVASGAFDSGGVDSDGVNPGGVDLGWASGSFSNFWSV